MTNRLLQSLQYTLILSFTLWYDLMYVSAQLDPLEVDKASEQVVLVASAGTTTQDTEDKISYRCTFRNLWTNERQPVNYPEDSAAWNGPVMWTHTLDYEPWGGGRTVDAGIEDYVEVSVD